jgi:autotransporter-associated beta strand protein
MKPKHHIFCLFASLPLIAAVQAQTSTWNVSGGGSWNDSASWDPAAVPTTTDNVVFNTSVDTPVTLGANQVAASLSASSTAASASNANRITLTGGGTNRTLVVSGATTVSGTVNFVVGSTTGGQNVNLTTTSITKSGGNNLELANANTIGDISIEQGRLFGRNANAFGLAASGTITLGSVAAANNIEFRLGTANYAAKPVVLGPTTGFIRIDTLGASNPTANFPVTGTNNLQIASTNSASGPASLTYNTGPIDPTGNLTLSNLGSGTAFHSQLTINAPIGGNVANVTATGTGTTSSASFIRVTSPANAYTGNTTINPGVAFQLGASEVIPHGEGKGDVVLNGILELRPTAGGDTVETINGLSGGVDAKITRTGEGGISTLVFGGNNAGGTYDGMFEENGGSQIALTKIGTGEIILTSTSNGYSGATTVEGGTLTLKDSSFLPSGGVISVAAGAKLNLDYTGTSTAATFRIAGVAQFTGKWGRIGSIAALGADFETDAITGNGLINVTNTSGDVFWDGTGNSWAAVSSWSFSPTAASPDPASGPSEAFGAVFGTSELNSPQTVNLNTNPTAAELRFISPVAFTLLGGGSDRTLTLGGRGLNVTAVATSPVIGSATSGQQVNLALLGDQVWTQNSTDGTLSLKNQVTGSGTLTLNGAGNIAFEGPVSGITNLSITGSGAVGFTNSVELLTALTVSGSGSTSFAGPVSGITNLSITGSGNTSFTGALSGDMILSKKGTGTLSLSGANTFTGDKLIDQGIVNVDGNQSASPGSWLLRGYGDTGTTWSTTASTVEIATGATVSIPAGKTVQAGNSSPNGGFLAQTLNSAGTVTNDGTLTLGRAGTLNVTGGTWTQNGLATVATQGGGIATLRISGGTFIHANAGAFLLNTSTSNNTVANLIVDNGTFATGTEIRNNNANLSPEDSAFATITLSNGGTLKLTANIADLFTTAGANRRVLLGEGNGVIDTNGFTTDLNVPISGTGGLTKAGAGTLNTTDINTYAGNTVVAGGTLALASASLPDTGTVTIATGSKLKLNFTGEDTIAALTVGTTNLDAGTYDKVSHPLFIEGDGKLVVVPLPDATFATWAAGLGLSGDPEADFDNDGIADSLEFVLGTDPKASNPSGITTQDVGDDLIFTFNRDDRSETADLTLSVEAGGTLQAWPQVFMVKDTSANSTPGVSITENAEAADTVTVTIPKNGAEKLFARIKVIVSGS